MKKYAVFFTALFYMTCVAAYTQSLGDLARDEQKRREGVSDGIEIILESAPLAVPDEISKDVDADAKKDGDNSNKKASTKGSGTNRPSSGAQAVAAVNAFAIDVYKQLAAESGNLFFSPYNISSALAMAYAGARGNTAAEMAKALRFTGIETEIHESMKSLQDRLNSIPYEEGILEAANGLWVDELEQIEPGYEALARKNYGAEAKTADFSSKPRESERMINDWVAQKTRDKIRDVFNGNVSPATKMVLVSAIYFNSAWFAPFKKALTETKPFTAGDGRERGVPMMHREGYYSYGENSDAQWVKIPYRIPGFSMLILLPRENSSFTQMEYLEKKLTSNTLVSWTADMRYIEVDLRMPKFRDERSYPLKGILQKLGMNAAFDMKKSDFSGMLQRSDGFSIDNVVHKTFIEVDEEKTEAAAVTGVFIALGAAPKPPPVEFNADHPFIYCIVDDNAGGLILFMGRMEQP